MEDDQKNDQNSDILSELSKLGSDSGLPAAPEDGRSPAGKKKKFAWLYVSGAIAALIIAVLIYWGVSANSSYSSPTYDSAATGARQEAANLKGIISSVSPTDVELSRDFPDSSSVQAFSQTLQLADKLVSSPPSCLSAPPKNADEASSDIETLKQWTQRAKNLGYELTQQAQEAGIYEARAFLETQKKNLKGTLSKVRRTASASLVSQADGLLAEPEPSSPSGMADLAQRMKSLAALLSKE